MPGRDLTPLGVLLERARTEVAHLSLRQAAARAGISEATWRHYVNGFQQKGGARVPISPHPRRVVAMADAVGVDPAEAARAAGLSITPEAIAAIREDMARAPAAPTRAAGEPTFEEVVARILSNSNLSPTQKRAAIRAYTETYEGEHPDEPGEAAPAAG